MKKVVLFFASLSIVFASTQDALNAYKSGKYKEAFDLYSKEAKAGDTTAQNALSYLYFNGVGVDKDDHKALIWLKKAADTQDSRACFDLGMMYLAGEHVKKDTKKAFHYLSIAADKGNVEAKYNLAYMYYNGDGVKQDVNKAASLLEEAAKAGHIRAKQNVGRIYLQAFNFKKAKYWLQKNAQEGDVQAQTLLDEIAPLKKD
jgi:TPR repeat protein